MNKPITEAEIREIRERAKKNNKARSWTAMRLDLDFAESARTDIPRLLDERETLLAIVRELVDVVREWPCGHELRPQAMAAYSRGADYLDAIHKGETK